MAETTEKIAWVVIAVCTLMQVFGALFHGSTQTAPFSDLPEVTDTASLLDWVGSFILSFCQLIFSFVIQDWATGFPTWLQFIIAVLFDLSLLLLVSGNTALLIVTVIAAIIGGILSLF